MEMAKLDQEEVSGGERGERSKTKRKRIESDKEIKSMYGKGG